jgi:hypothetical protein
MGWSFLNMLNVGKSTIVRRASACSAKKDGVLPGLQQDPLKHTNPPLRV